MSSPTALRTGNPGADVRSPVLAVLCIGVATFFLLTGYEFLRSASSSLYIGAYTSERVPIVMALGPVGTLLFVYFYAALLSRFGSGKALLITSLFSGAAILTCYVSVGMGSRVATGVLYVLREAYVVVIIEQYWSFINSTLNRTQAGRLNGPICGIASLGSILGAKSVHLLVAHYGSANMLLFAAASLVPAAACSAIAFRLGGQPEPTAPERERKRGTLALALFKENPVLAYLALLIFLTQVMAAVLEIRFNGLVEIRFPDTDLRTAYFGDFWFYLNSVAAALQFVVAPLLLHWVRPVRIHAAFPLIHIVACAALLLWPSLVTGAAAFMVFKSVDYSLFRAAKELLYLPLSFDARYRAKELIDAFGYRASKGIASGAIALAGQVFGAIPGAVYPGIALVAAGSWLAAVLRLLPPTSNAVDRA